MEPKEINEVLHQTFLLLLFFLISTCGSVLIYENYYIVVVSHAPRNFNRKIPTLEELETDVKLALPTSEVSIYKFRR